MMQNKCKIIITTEGGVITDVSSNFPIECMTVDLDEIKSCNVDDFNPENIIKLYENEEPVHVSVDQTAVNPIAVNNCFDKYEKHKAALDVKKKKKKINFKNVAPESCDSCFFSQYDPKRKMSFCSIYFFQVFPNTICDDHRNM